MCRQFRRERPGRKRLALANASARRPVAVPMMDAGSGVIGVDLAEEAVGFIVDAGGEVYGVRVETVDAVPGLEGPEMIVDQGLAVCAVDRAEEHVRGCVIGEDLAVAKVADQQIVAERAEVGGGDDDSPGGEERAVACDAAEEVAARIVLIDEAAGQRYATREELGIGHVEVPSDVLDVEGDETGGQAGVGELAGKGGARDVSP